MATQNKDLAQKAAYGVWRVWPNPPHLAYNRDTISDLLGWNLAARASLQGVTRGFDCRPHRLGSPGARCRADRVEKRRVEPLAECAAGLDGGLPLTLTASGR